MSWRFGLLLISAAGIYLLANGSVPLWDRDEPRYAQTSKQMVESGDWVFPKLLDEPRLAKPIFIYWCQAASMKLFGTTDWAARFPSVLAAMLTVALLYLAICREISPSHAIWTAFIFATSALTIMAAKMSITDAVLTLFVTASQLCLYRLWMGKSDWPTMIVFGVSIGLACLTKGPVVVGVMVTTTLILLALRVYDRRRATPSPGNPGEGGGEGSASFPRLAKVEVEPSPQPSPMSTWEREHYLSLLTKSSIAILIVLAILLPWIIAMERRIPGYFWNTLQTQVFERIKTPQEGHKGPPGYYLLTVWGTFFPWSLLLPAAMVQGWKNRSSPAVRFAFAAVVGPWIMFECVATKLPHYVLPTFPFIAFLTADMLSRAAKGEHPDITSDAFVKLVRVWGGVVAVLGSALWIFVPMFPPISWRGIISLVFLTVISAEYVRHVYLYFRARRVFDASLALGAGWLVIFALMYGAFLPEAWFLRISPRVADVLKREMHPGDRALMIDYKETSLAFYQGGTIRPERRNSYLQDEPPANWPEYLVLTMDIWQKTPETIQDQWTQIDKVRGLAYTDDGRIVDVLVLRRIGSAEK
jgi:4-amino-4-deoxy-L-arabinose transferase-like glycosyltransferase